MKYTKWFLASSLICATGIMADQAEARKEGELSKIFRHGDKLPKDKYPAGYNVPAGIQLENKNWSPDIYTTASFLYYYASQGGLDLADSGMTVTTTGTPYTSNTTNSSTLSQESAFKPGFQVGIGVGYNESFLSGSYTWIRQTTHTSKGAPTPEPALGAGSWILNNWFQQLSPAATPQTMSATHISSKWHLGLDVGDVLINHAFYQGQSLIVKPFLGLRGAWIRQSMDVGITLPTSIFTNTTSPVIHSVNSSNSWGVGPRVGLDASYLLGMGIRFEGRAAASLLVTQFTHVRHKEDQATVGVTPTVLGSSIHNYNCVRPEGDLGIGLGWGMYSPKGRFHFDLTANYDFLVFFEQNMIRKLLDQTISGVSPAVSNLYFQGLNITARFDF